MSALTALDDINHFWGGDILRGPTGDLGRVNRVDRSKQRVFRRLMTNPGDYIFHPEYGAGVPRMVGDIEDDAAIIGAVRGQVLLEPSVASSPEPTVTLSRIANGISLAISYTVLPEKQPVALSFDVQAI